MNESTETQITHHTSGWLILSVAVVLIITGPLIFFEQSQHKWWGLILIAIGLYLCFFARWETLCVDKQTKEVTITSKRLFGLPIVRTHPFSSIKAVEIEKQISKRTHNRGGDRSSSKTITYYINFYKKNGEMDAMKIKPSVSFSVAGMLMSEVSAHNKAIKLGNNIAEMIGVPCKLDHPGIAGLGELISDVGRAIKANKDKNNNVAPSSNAAPPEPTNEQPKQWGS